MFNVYFKEHVYGYVLNIRCKNNFIDKIYGQDLGEILSLSFMYNDWAKFSGLVLRKRFRNIDK
jgi:hypothetical protein